jgi:hypothetical protein
LLPLARCFRQRTHGKSPARGEAEFRLRRARNPFETLWLAKSGEGEPSLRPLGWRVLAFIARPRTVIAIWAADPELALELAAFWLAAQIRQ